jgi:hypothetical protein
MMEIDRSREWWEGFELGLVRTSNSSTFGQHFRVPHINGSYRWNVHGTMISEEKRAFWGGKRHAVGGKLSEVSGEHKGSLVIAREHHGAGVSAKSMRGAPAQRGVGRSGIEFSNAKRL